MFLLIVSLLLDRRLVQPSQDFCAIVRQQFVDMDLGDGSEVPFTYRNGRGRGVCGSGGCCSPTMERAFTKRVKRDYVGISKTYFEHLYEGIRVRADHFQMSIERYILHNARISLKTCSQIHANATQDAAQDAAQDASLAAQDASLAARESRTTRGTANASDILSSQKQSVIDIYSNITHYFKQVDRRKDVNVKKLVKSFVKQNLALKKLKSVSCIKATSVDLERALNAAWLVKESLKFGRSLFATIKHWRPSDNCVDALVQMNFCSLCHPNYVYQISQPCTKYCINVHKGCLAAILQISPKITEWSRLLQSLLSELRYELSFYNAMSGLNHLIHATLASSTLEEICEHADYNYEDNARLTLDYHLVRLSDELTLYDNVFDTLPYTLCDKQHYSQPGSENYCWNGTAMSTYNCHVADSGLYSPNPTQIVISDAMLSQQEARLREIVAMLYQETGIAPSPTPQIELDVEDQCWDPAFTTVERHNMSDKRDHITNKTTTSPSRPDQQRSKVGSAAPPSSSPALLLMFLAILCSGDVA